MAKAPSLLVCAKGGKDPFRPISSLLYMSKVQYFRAWLLSGTALIVPTRVLTLSSTRLQVVTPSVPRSVRRPRSEITPIVETDPAGNYLRPMTSSLIQISRQREHLSNELSAIRQASLKAARNNDFRGVARFTLEAAKINKAIADVDTQAELAR